MTQLPKDLREFVESLNSHNVEYVIVGGYALAFHSRPRYTGDLDFLVRPSPQNAQRLERALRAFGFASVDISQEDCLREGQVIQLGYPPNRIDILTSLTGVDFDEVWKGRVKAMVGGVEVAFIGRSALIENKRATGRPQDLADVATLEEAEGA